ncbi:serine/threonine protein kinase [Crocinitomicaceae bacterium]|nr:serine/threonine protein kinase [Crocinitomicaceae bacterium]
MAKIGENIEIIQKLKEGGTANVYRGLDTWTGFPVAVKELKSNFFKSEFVRQKFIQEANQYLYLNHPNIVKLKNFIDAGDTAYLVMEFVDGHNLNDYQNNITGPMPVGMAALLITEVLKALDHAHDNGVYHLDIKPANIMLSEKNEVKVLDFGIAQDVSEKNSDKMVGTPSYMSPEQIDGKGIDERTDVYAAGVTLYELITGAPPFSQCKDRTELFQAIKNTPVPIIQGERFINTIIQKATSKKKKNRYASYKEFYADLMEVV